METDNGTLKRLFEIDKFCKEHKLEARHKLTLQLASFFELSGLGYKELKEIFKNEHLHTNNKQE